jgi:FkbM family methyltransferase
VVTIERIGDGSSAPALARESRFRARGEFLEGVDYFLEHEGVLYPHPLRSESDQSVRLYPEAPGRYVLHAAWRAQGGKTGVARIDFDVSGPHGGAPRRVAADRDTLWVPTEWDAHLIGAHETTVLAALKAIVRPAATVFDIGANVGLFSTRFLKWIGAAGWLYAVEPNPVCVYFLRANLEQTRARNYTILPVALADAQGEASFSVNYGSSMIGAGTSSAAGSGKPGHRIGVLTDGLDAVIAKFDLRPPDFVKLDVEGAEANAVAGMRATLVKRRPILMIELHGREAASDTLQHLQALKYSYLLASSGQRYDTAEALFGALPDACVQVIGYP